MEGGPSIRDYIDARKKSGMSWDEFRALKDKNEGNEFSDSAMLAWRKQLDAEREAKLNKGRSSRAPVESGKDGKGKRKHERRHHSSKHDDSQRKAEKRHRRDRSRSRERSRERRSDKHRHRHSHRRRSSSPKAQDRKDKGTRKSRSDTVDDSVDLASRRSASPEKTPRQERRSHQ
ncbi:hypothetical protein GGI20_001584 [Coemansia sp. BCRC 34301]|nr:hypothetical protein GGI20_001584 [Coemansia sp. BCRC 34301]